jgi:hypothetical protein
MTARLPFDATRKRGANMYARMTAILLLLLVTNAVALGADGKNARSAKTGTEHEQEACTPDAMKFCDDKIPDTFAVLACLQVHRQRLSKACRHVLEANGQ